MMIFRFEVLELVALCPVHSAYCTSCLHWNWLASS